MDPVIALIEALDAPAALAGPDGLVVAANAAFRESGQDPGAVLNLRPGEVIETLSSRGGALIAWRLARLPDGRRLITGERRSEGPTQRDRYLASLSHELRTPLNGVLGMADLLADTRLAADQRAYLLALQESGRHLLGLVNDVLDLACLDAGEFALHPAPVEPRRLLQSTAELLSPRATEKGLEIAWTAPADLPVVLADEGRIRQILFNLAGNAVKFTERGGVLLSAERCGGDARRARLRFSVSDTGPGVPEAERERIFEPFVQAHGDRLRTDSAGLGLAIVRRLTAAHGGRISLESPPEGGARFCFEADFPVERAPARGKGPLARRNVVVVSSNPVVRAAAAGLVEAAGGKAWAFGDAAEAQAGAPRDAVALVDHALIDRAQAGGARRGRLAKPLDGRPSVVLLAPEERAHIPRYRRAGFDGYLIKPLRDVSLIERTLAAAGAAAAPAEAADERADSQTGADAGARVLLVEDNPINALLARSLLEREGCLVDHAVGGREAIKAAEVQSFDLVLMDLRMPGLDGIGAAEALRAMGIKTPIIALTADAFEEDRRACLAAGMDDFLAKPLAPEALRAALRRWAGPVAAAGRKTPARKRRA
ncbi:MAG: response regulator [Caulobacteraceae bacterium]|nr:response regulator [Caulobacteraceae bacterium]